MEPAADYLIATCGTVSPRTLNDDENSGTGDALASDQSSTACTADVWLAGVMKQAWLVLRARTVLPGGSRPPSGFTLSRATPKCSTGWLNCRIANGKIWLNITWDAYIPVALPVRLYCRSAIWQSIPDGILRARRIYPARMPRQIHR